jgi:hypothetical protein
MSIARVALTGPIAGAAFSGAHAEGDRQAEYNRTSGHESLDAKPVHLQQEMCYAVSLNMPVHEPTALVRGSDALVISVKDMDYRSG